MKSKLIYILIAFATYYSISNATAELVSFEISATVNNVDDMGNALEGSVVAGDIITGTYTIDTSTPDNNPSPEYGDYPHLTSVTSPSIGFNLNLNNHHLKSDHSNPNHMFQIFIDNSMSDYFSVGSWGNTPLNNGTSVDDIIIHLHDPTDQALTSDALSSQAPNLSAFDYHNLHVFGRGLNNSYYFIDSTIVSIKIAGRSDGQNQCSSNTISNKKFFVNATVREIFDDSNVINNAINIGDTISGSYIFNINTPDTDPNPDWGFFEHQTAYSEYGFDLNINNYNITTGNNLFNIIMVNGQSEADMYDAHTAGAQIPFINSSTINTISVHINDPLRNTIASATLTTTPPIISGQELIRELYIGGETNTPTGTSYFYISATLNTIENECAELQNKIIISPAEGTFDPMQRFDAAIIMEPGLAGLISMKGTLNDVDMTPILSSCFPGGPNIQNRQTFICPDFSNLLTPGNNKLKINFDLSDGSQIQKSVDWELISF